MATLTATASLSDIIEQFEDRLTDRAAVLWQLSGFEEEYGLPLAGMSYARETKEVTDELTGMIVSAIRVHMQAQQTDKGVGRPPDVIAQYLRPRLLSFFLRC